MSNTDKVAWNADGPVESAGDYQTRFNAHTSAWCRPALVPVSPDGTFMSLFVDNEIGPWQARHDLTFAQYQAEFDNWTKQGFFPANVQGGGSGLATRYSALFVKSVQPVTKQWTTTGPVTNAAIDLIIGEAMMNSPVRHASLAIIHGTTLVYARGYIRRTVVASGPTDNLLPPGELLEDGHGAGHLPTDRKQPTQALRPDARHPDAPNPDASRPHRPTLQHNHNPAPT
jgi:hypothetical protein